MGGIKKFEKNTFFFIRDEVGRVRVEDLYAFEETYIKPAQRLAINIETSGTYITLIGIATSREVAIVIPFPYPERSI
jgi:hypothetical protein